MVICISADRDVLEIIRRLAPELAAGDLVIDCSTVAASTARQAASILAETGIEFLDCPVSGGTEGARSGALSIMAGGSGTVPSSFVTWNRMQPCCVGCCRGMAFPSFWIVGSRCRITRWRS